MIEVLLEKKKDKDFYSTFPFLMRLVNPAISTLPPLTGAPSNDWLNSASVSLSDGRPLLQRISNCNINANSAMYNDIYEM